MFASRRIVSPKWWRNGGNPLLSVIGVLGAVAGAWLAQTGNAVPVYSYHGQLHVGNSVLTASGPNEYTGDAAVITVTVSPGVTKSVASANVNGSRSNGICLETQKTPGHLDEGCTFVIDGHTLTASDTFDAGTDGGWHRHYSDGVDVTILVPAGGGVVPVPFPVGR